jgi:hypothetical protein
MTLSNDKSMTFPYRIFSTNDTDTSFLKSKSETDEISNLQNGHCIW